MRIYTVTDKDTDLQSLAAGLTRSARAAAAALDSVKALNPDIAGLRKLKPGTVLVLPDSGIKPGAGEPANGARLDEVGAQLGNALNEVDSRAAARLEALAADQAAVRDSLKAAAAKRLVESDPLLTRQLAASDAWYKAEQKRVADARAQVAELAKQAQAEFERMQKLLG